MEPIPKCPFPLLEKYLVPTKGVRVDVGCGENPEAGYVTVDICSPHADMLCDFEKGLPFKDSSVSFIKCVHILEHLSNLFEFMDECWRVLDGNQWVGMFVAVPRGDHWHSYGDPEHKRRFHPNTFIYFTPFWHYENRVKKWEITQICWCEESEIRVLMKPIKTRERMDEFLKARDTIRKEQGHKIIGYC